MEEVAEDTVLYRYLDALLTEDDVDIGQRSQVSGNRGGTVHGDGNIPAPGNATLSDSLSAEISVSPDAIFSAGDTRAIIFHVGKTKLALPVRLVNAVIDWNRNISVMPDQGPHIAGSFQYQGNTARVLDTSFLLNSEESSDNRHDYGKIIVLNESRYGIACHKIDSMMAFDYRNIKWRRDRNTRPWYAGVEIAEMCLIIDVGYIVKYLNNNEL